MEEYVLTRDGFEFGLASFPTPDAALSYVRERVFSDVELTRYGVMPKPPAPPEPEHRKRLRETVHVGTVVESCNLHALTVTHVDGVADDLEGVSLLDGKTYRCSLYHCGIVVMTEADIKKKLELWKSGGKEALSADYAIQRDADIAAILKDDHALQTS